MSRTLVDLQADCEAVSRVYEARCAFDRDDDWQLLKLQEEAGELVSAYLRLTGRGRPKGDGVDEIRRQFEDELADCLAQVLLIAERFDVDLERAIERKWLPHLGGSGAGL